MGAASSLVTLPREDNVEESVPIPEIVIKQLPEVIEESVYLHEKFPLVIDPTGKAKMFLKYQTGAFITQHEFNDAKLINRCLAGCIIHGKTFTAHFETLDDSTTVDFFDPNSFPKEVLSRTELYKEGVCQKIFRPEDGDDPEPSPQFIFILCTSCEVIPPELLQVMRAVKVVESKGEQKTLDTDNDLDVIAGLYGAKEIVRNSKDLVECAFDGDLDGINSWIEKGYHIESVDGRKHTALSEAACNGHMDVINFLIEQGADPNTKNDTGRTPLWRASFNGHTEIMRVLLEAGADPDAVDKTSMETAFDVAKNAESRDLLSSWDKSRTEALLEKRKAEILASAEARIRTSAEREEFAKQKLRTEAVEFASKGDLVGLKNILLLSAEEAEKSNSRPRVTAEARNNTGQSLLSIATQNNDAAMAEFLLTHWKKCDEDRWDLAEGEMSMEAKVFKTNPNSRDLKGWSCVCIAVFHESKDCLNLLLSHGGDPLLRSSYNKNAWDLAKDDLDAANKVVRSRAEIRQVLVDFDNKNASKIFGKGSACPIKPSGDIEEGLDENGSPIVMQKEMENEASIAPSNSKKSKKGSGKNVSNAKKDGKKTTSKKVKK